MLSCVQLFCKPMDYSRQAPWSMGFPRHEAGVGCHFLLQGISLTQRSNLCLHRFGFFTTELSEKPRNTAHRINLCWPYKYNVNISIMMNNHKHFTSYWASSSWGACSHFTKRGHYSKILSNSKPGGGDDLSLTL